MNMDIFVKDFSRTNWPRILKFGTNIRYDRLYCVRKNQPHKAYQFLYLSIFLSNKYAILSAQYLWVLQSSNFVYTIRTTKCINVNKTKVLRFIFAFFFSSPEPKAHRWAYSIWRYPSSVRPSSVRLSTFSNNISSEAMRPILFIFHI